MSSFVSLLHRRPDVWVPLLVACAFLPSLRAGFVYDDVRLIVENSHVQTPDLWARAFSTHFWDISSTTSSPEVLRLYRPLVTLSYQVNWILGHGQPWMFHLTNLLLHVLNVWLALTIALRLTKSRPLAIVSTLFFALHPTRSEAVIWVSGRPDLLMTLFVLITVQFAYWGRERGARPVAVLGVALSFCAALLNKEPALATPVFLLADAVAARRSARTWHLSMVALTALLGACYLALRHWLLPVGSPPLLWTPADALVTVSHYAERVSFPWPLTFFYELGEADAVGWRASPWNLALGALLVSGTIAWSVFSWRRDRTAFWLIVAGLAFLGPLLNITRTGARFTTSDRFLYLPFWLWLLAACRSGLDVHPLAHGRPTRLVVAGTLACCIAMNVTRALDFTSERTFWQSELALNPDNPVALRGLSAQEVQSGDTAAALRHLEHSLEQRALRFYRVTTPSENVDAYGRLLALKATTFPDGSTAALRALVQDGVDRLAEKPRQSRSDLLPIDWPENEHTVRWVAQNGEAALARHLVALATRLDVRDVSLALLDAIADEHLRAAPNPLFVALGEAREQRFVRALERIAFLRKHRALMPKVVTEGALADLEARIVAARGLFESAEALGNDEGRLARARALATLGAFYRALLEVQQVDPRHPGMLPLYVQLLVSARLESAALQVASQALGSERAAQAIDAIRAQLAPDLAALAPVEFGPAVARPPAL